MTHYRYVHSLDSNFLIGLVIFWVLLNFRSRGKNWIQINKTSPQDLAQPQEYLHKWFTTEEIPLREAGEALWTNVAPLCADYRPFFRQGAGERYCWAEQQQTLGSLLYPSSPAPPAPPLRNQAGPGLRRTEPHRALLIDKSSWKKRTANPCATLFQSFSLWAGLWDASRLKRPFEKRSTLDF